MRIVKELVDKEVIDESAVIIGKVKDLEVNLETNEITALVVSKRGFANLGFSNNEIVISYDMVKKIGDKILIGEEVPISDVI